MSVCSMWTRKARSLTGRLKAQHQMSAALGHPAPPAGDRQENRAADNWTTGSGSTDNMSDSLQ
jgi:hypothetical protein